MSAWMSHISSGVEERKLRQQGFFFLLPVAGEEDAGKREAGRQAGWSVAAAHGGGEWGCEWKKREKKGAEAEVK